SVGEDYKTDRSVPASGEDLALGLMHGLRLMVITLFIVAVTLTSPGATSFSQSQNQPAQLTLDSAVNTALLMSTQARRAEITLEEQLVTALGFEHQHR